MKKLLLALLVLFLVGCPPPRSAHEALVQAVAMNNASVEALSAAQVATRASRVAALEIVAKTAPSLAEGKASLTKIDADYAPVFALFLEAEQKQAALATLLEAAVAAEKAGKAADLAGALRAYAELQSAYAKVVQASAEVSHRKGR